MVVYIEKFDSKCKLVQEMKAHDLLGPNPGSAKIKKSSPWNAIILGINSYWYNISMNALRSTAWVLGLRPGELKDLTHQVLPMCIDNSLSEV